MSYETLGENEFTLTLAPNSGNIVVQQFPSDTVISTTFYIANTSQLPLGSTDTVDVQITDSITGQFGTFSLTSYLYGKYIENYPIQQMFVKNNFPVTVNFYIQYIIKKFYQYYSPDIQDLTQLQLTTTLITDALSAGTNFRYFGTLANISFSGIPLTNVFYILDEQVVGTSSASYGSVTVPWTSTYSRNIVVPALGTAEDSTSYIFNIDSTTKTLPGAATSTNATMNWVEMDFYSPLQSTITDGTVAITFNSTTGAFEVNDDVSTTWFAQYFNALGAPFTSITTTVS